MEDDFNRSMRECEDLIGRLAQFGTHSPLIESTNTFREKTQERLAQLRAKFPRPPVQEQRAPTPPPPPEVRSRPDWLAQATERTAQSPEFRQLCRELLWRVESSESDFGGQSSVERCATLDDAYARLQRESAVAGQFEAFAAATLDNALAERAALYRLDGAESYVDACEREASGAIMGLLDSLPGDDAPGALRALVGRALPQALRERLWARRLTDPRIQREFRDSRGDWSTRSPHEADVTAFCVKVLSDTDGDKLCCARSAFSFLDAKARESGGPLPSDVYWLSKPLMEVLALDDAVLASAVRCVLERGLEPATKPEGTLAFGDDSTDNQSVLEGGAGAAALALRLGVQRKNTQRWWVPRDWLRRCRSLLVELCPALAKALTCEEDTDDSENVIARAIGRSMRRGLSDILSTEVLLFVWDQCVLASFDLVIPYAAACVLALLDEPLQFFLRDNDDPQVHEALMRLGKDLQLTDVETCFRRVVPRIAPDARELTDAISARPPPGLLVEASLPGAATLGGLADVVVDSLADGAGFTMHGIVSVSRLFSRFVAQCARRHSRGHTPTPPARHHRDHKHAGTLHCFLRNLDCRLEWCEVFPAKDSLPNVVDRLLALPANRKRILKARQQWGDQGGFDSSLREACAIAACRALPGLAALYAGSYPATIQDPLKDVIKDCVRFSLPVRADDDDRDGDGVKDDVEYEATTGALLGEHVPQVDVLLRKNSKPQDPGLGPGSALLQAAGILAIRAAPGSLWPHYSPGLMHLVYLAYNSLREQHHLAGIEESKQKEIAAAEKAIDNCRRAEARKKEAAQKERDSMNAQEQAKLDEQYRIEAREQQKKRIEAADAADEKVKDAFLACVNAAKECGDTYKKCREAFEAKERWRKELIDSLVEREQKAAFKQVFASPSDVAEYCVDAKKAKAYAKKFAKFEKSIRKAWAKSPDLKDPYVLPDAGAVDALVDRWRGPGA